ncbi:MAG TPA: FtsX-like permease family protein, partial [Chitinophagaceae bacterium]|nr:FtsX-like permease family protein [Chitinophagaceae bacterium]
IRKAVGSVRSQLVSQFFSESYLVVILAFIIALGLTGISLNTFNAIADKHIQLPFGNFYFWLFSVLFIAITGLLSGLYPAFYLSSFQPVKILKGTFKTGKLAAIPRKVFVVVQFTVSVALIIGTFVVYKQIRHAQNRPAGYDRNSLVTVPTNDPDYRGKLDVLKSELLNSGFVSNVSFSFSPLTQVWNNIKGFSWEGKDPQKEDEFIMQQVSDDFGKTVNWEIKQGRDYSKDFATDTASLIINESAAKYLGFSNPVGQRLFQKSESKYFTIIGVVKDLIMTSPYEPVQQTFFFLDRHNYYTNNVHFKLKPTVAAGKAMPQIEAVFRQIVPSASFDFKFVDDEYNSKFKAEQRIGTLASIFAALAIFISCLGLFGLASFVAERRTKEIGIRKVLGATVVNLWQMLSREFVVLVIISCVIAAPVAWYFMNEWLQKYTYRTKIEWWVFIAAIGGALLITLLTVSFQAIKAAIANPVTSLRTE